MNKEFTRQEINAVLLYQGCGVPGEYDAFYHQDSAYRCFNMLMMEGQSGERVRICAEGQRPDKINILRWEKTLEILEQLFTVQCKFARQQTEAGKPLPNPLARGDRKVNFDLMCAAGGTVAFTSTSKGEVQDDFLFGKQEPHALHITLSGQVPYLDFEEFFGSAYSFENEREVLLPPMVKMVCGDCRMEHHPGIGPVPHYDITFTGFGVDIEAVDEDAAKAFLHDHAAAAADALTDLVKNKLDAAVWADDRHIYWQWKAAFRKLTLQRMQKIYESYYGEK